MQKEENSRFLVARMTNDGAVVGSLYLTMTSSSSGDSKTTVTMAEGNFGAVAVSRKYEKMGIGKNLIEAAATFTRKRRAQLQSGKKPREERVQAKLTMGVINLREDLFGWYGRQGFVKGEEIRPNNAELQRICLPELDICLVLMHKDLD